jgi:hypothetical protein
MNKKILKVVAASALVATFAATTVMADEQQFGMGVGVAGTDSTTIRGTVSLDDGLRLEPFFGFTYQNPDKGDAATNVNVGTALHMTKMINSKINAYYGGFVGIARQDDGDNIDTIFNLGPVAGVEYAFDKQFTLGAEVRFDLGLGDNTVIGTDSSVLLRYYFN